jgi:hypothetical protein
VASWTIQPLGVLNGATWRLKTTAREWRGIGKGYPGQGTDQELGVPTIADTIRQHAGGLDIVPADANGCRSANPQR